MSTKDKPEGVTETPAQEFQRLVAAFNKPESDSAQEEAWHWIADFALEHADTIAAALEAALPSGVRVAKLEWREIYQRRSDEDPRLEWTGGYETWTPFGIWEIGMGFGSDAYYWSVSDQSGDDIGSDFTSAEDAKAAAQADYERRILSALSPSRLSANEGVKVEPLDDDQIMEIIREAAPWKSEPKLNDLLTYEKSPPMFPQATYDVPSYRATKFVRAVERRILSALTTKPEGVRDEHSLFDDFGCEFDDDCYVIRWQSSDGHMDSLTAFKTGKIIVTRSPFSDVFPPKSHTFESLLSTQPPTPASGEQMEDVAENFLLSSMKSEFWVGRLFSQGFDLEAMGTAITAANERAERAERDAERAWEYTSDASDDKLVLTNDVRVAEKRAETAEALNTTLSEALEKLTHFYEQEFDPETLIRPDWLKTALADLPAKQGGQS